MEQEHGKKEVVEPLAAIQDASGKYANSNLVERWSEAIAQAQIPRINLDAVHLELVVVDAGGELLGQVVACAESVVGVCPGLLCGGLHIRRVGGSAPG